MTADIRSQLYRRLELLSLQFYDNRQVGALMSRVTRDSGRLEDFLVDGLPYLVINSLTLVGILAALLAMHWQLTVYVIIPAPLVVLGAIFCWRRMRRFYARWFRSWSELTGRVNEALSGIRVVKAFAQEKREIWGVREDQPETHGAGGSGGESSWAVFAATTNFLAGLGVLIVWFFGGQRGAGGGV